MAVVATLPSLATDVHEVGGTDVRVVALVDEQGDPLVVDPQPGLMGHSNRADLRVGNAPELEIRWLPPAVRRARKPRLLAGGPGYVEAAEFVAVRQVIAYPSFPIPPPASSRPSSPGRWRLNRRRRWPERGGWWWAAAGRSCWLST